VTTEYSTHTLAQRPELRASIDRLGSESWPRFLLHGDMRHWHLLFEMFPGYQLLLCDSEDRLVAVGHTVPLVWDGCIADLPATMDEIILRAERAALGRREPNTLSAVAAMVAPGHRGRGLSRSVVHEMKSLAARRSCASLIAPVRPTWKSLYPLTPMERYVEWKRADGAPFDPWIRVHWRLGAVPLCVASNTLTVEGTVKDWEEWTQMSFPETGEYVVPGALQPVRVDREHDTGRYDDPNYWMKHPGVRIV